LTKLVAVATILRKLPICTEPKTLQLLGGAKVAIKRDQIVLWVSVTQPGLAQFPIGAPQIPAVLDTGFNSTFLIAEKQLQEWTGVAAKDLTWIDLLSADGQPIPLRDADIWIHPNRAYAQDTIPGRQPFRLELAEGIGVWPSAIPGARRLPLLGMRALRGAGVQVHLDCRKGLVSMNTRRWFWFL
jgi:hypothetical protein